MPRRHPLFREPILPMAVASIVTDGCETFKGLRLLPIEKENSGHKTLQLSEHDLACRNEWPRSTLVWLDG